MDLQVNASAKIDKINSEKAIVSSFKKNDQFEVIYEDGDRYIGNFENSLPQGFGKIIDKDGGYSIGNLINGKFYGSVKVYINGKLHIEGNCENGLLNGETKIYDKYNRLAFTGSFRSGKADGLGSLFVDGKKITGDFKEGKVNGVAVLHFIKEEIKIAGNFHNNKLIETQHAIFIKSNSSVFLGSLNDGCTPEKGYLLVNSLNVQDNKDSENSFVVSKFNNGEGEVVSLYEILLKNDNKPSDSVLLDIDDLLEISKKIGFDPSSENILNVYREYINRFDKEYKEHKYSDSKIRLLEYISLDFSVGSANSLSLINGNNVENKEINQKFNRQLTDKYRPNYRTLDGHFVRSRGEVMIDDWLYNNKIAHEYEKRLPLTETAYCDFYLPDYSIYIEYWGLESEEYIIRKEEKRILYEKYNLNLLEITNDDIFDLDESMRSKLKLFMV